MNKMLKREIVNLNSKEKTYVNFFEDDSIQTVREQAAKSVNSHPDRMFIKVSLKLPKDHYTNDIRNWEALFDRLSYHSEKIEKTLFDEYQKNYRFPNTAVRYEEYDRTQWMEFPESLKPIFMPDGIFSEYRTLGVKDDRSYILELSGEGLFTKKIPSAELPIPESSKLIESFYEMKDIDHFGYEIYDPKHENVALYYYPKLVPDTLPRLSDESIRVLDKNAKLLEDILKLDVPSESKISILRVKFYVPWVETNFGASTRNRFEQIFYGLTVSKDVPYIGYFTCKDEINRHKFYVEDSKTKKPYLDTQLWKVWWNQTKPSQNKPTLLFYRGKCKESFDRIAVTDTGMTLVSIRESTCPESLDHMKKSFEKWLMSLDALIPFVNSKDIDIERWKMQDAGINIHYSSSIKSTSLLRFNCISPFFGINRKKDSVFTFLRSDTENLGLSSIEAILIEMMNEGPVTPDKVATELSITLRHANELIRHINTLLTENPALRNMALRKFPTITVAGNFILVKNITNIKLLTKYTNFLRFILSNPTSKDLDSICPARSETVESTKQTVAATSEEDFSIFGDFEDLGIEEEDAVETIKDETPEDTGEREISNQRQTKYGYFKSKLEEFDPETFSGQNNYARKCEYTIQPIPITPEKETQLSNFMDGQFNYLNTETEDEYMETTSPSGKYICPEYWCTRDELPLKQNQLLKEDGKLLCPVCKRGIHDETNNIKDFPVIERKKEYKYPNLQKELAKSGKQFPCCYKTPRTKRVKKDDSDLKDKAYVFQSSVRDLKELRIAKLDKQFSSAYIPKAEPYLSLENQRVVDGKSGFFRVGIGNPIKNFTKFLPLKGTRIPLPHDFPQITLRCSFVRTWTNLTDTHSKKVYDSLSTIKSEKTRMRLSKIVSGISDAFVEEKLSDIDLLEYLTSAYKCSVYLISDNKIVCSFGLPYSEKQIVIFKMGDSLSILAHVTRTGCKFKFNANIADSAVFPKVERALSKNKSQCVREVPSYEDAINVVSKLFPDESYTFIIDPYERAEAIYIPSKLVLPFRPSAVPDSNNTKVYGFESVTKLPSFTDTLRILESAETISGGYGFTESLYDVSGNISEVLTLSGLRIPVEPSAGKGSVPGEVMKTVDDEEELVSSESNPELQRVYDEISYISEVHEFLLFQLSRDLDTEDYRKLKHEFEVSPIKRTTAEKELRKWFDKTVSFIELKDAHTFISKIRTPCGQFEQKDCKGNLCGWDGKVCRIQVKNSLDKDDLFGRLFGTLFSNSKMRAAVLDGRITPFFSTILYIELPHEWIVTDKDIF
jgi:hypothetical protein